MSHSKNLNHWIKHYHSPIKDTIRGAPVDTVMTTRYDNSLPHICPLEITVHRARAGSSATPDYSILSEGAAKADAPHCIELQIERLKRRHTSFLLPCHRRTSVGASPPELNLPQPIDQSFSSKCELLHDLPLPEQLPLSSALLLLLFLLLEVAE